MYGQNFRNNLAIINKRTEQSMTPPDEPECCEDGNCGECDSCINEYKLFKEEERADGLLEERKLRLND